MGRVIQNSEKITVLYELCIILRFTLDLNSDDSYGTVSLNIDHDNSSPQHSLNNSGRRFLQNTSPNFHSIHSNSPYSLYNLSSQSARMNSNQSQLIPTNNLNSLENGLNDNSDDSIDSSDSISQHYPEFRPSPDSWLGDSTSAPSGKHF